MLLQKLLRLYQKAAIDSVLDSVPKGTEDKNTAAFEAGYNLI